MRSRVYGEGRDMPNDDLLASPRTEAGSTLG